MTHEEIDILLSKALRQSIQKGEQFTRYDFAALVAKAEREACAKVVEQTKWSNWFQADAAAAIRARENI